MQPVTACVCLVGYLIAAVTRTWWITCASAFYFFGCFKRNAQILRKKRKTAKIKETENAWNASLATEKEPYTKNGNKHSRDNGVPAKEESGTLLEQEWNWNRRNWIFKVQFLLFISVKIASELLNYRRRRRHSGRKRFGKGRDCMVRKIRRQWQNKEGEKYMIFGKYINKYYLKNAPILSSRSCSADSRRLFPAFHTGAVPHGHQRYERRPCSGQRPGGGV